MLANARGIPEAHLFKGNDSRLKGRPSGGGQQTDQQSGPEERDQVTGNYMTNDDIEIFLAEFSTLTRPTWWTLWNILV